MRPVVDYRSDSKHAYELFREKTKLEIPFKLWKSIIIQFNNEFAEYIMTSGDKVELPHGLGTTYVQKKKSTVRTVVKNGVELKLGSPDWNATRKLGKLVWHRNFHTDGYVAQFRWLPHTARFQHKDCFLLRYSKNVKRKLGQLLKSDKSTIYIDRYSEKLK